MNGWEAVRMALGTIRVQKLRTFFTVLGTVVGVTFLIAVITLINGMDAYMREDLGRKIVGLNTVTLRRGAARDDGRDAASRRAQNRRPAITYDDAEWLASRMDTPGTLSYSSQGSARVAGPRGRVLDNVRVSTTSAGYFHAHDFPVAEGRVFTEVEAERGLAVVVLGGEVAETLFEGRSALGRTVHIRGTPFRVVGVLEPRGTVLGFSFDQVVIAPARSPLNGAFGSRNVAGEVTFRAAEAMLVPVARAEMESRMRIRHRLAPGAPNDFSVSTSDSALGIWKQITQMMLIALPGLVGISLVVGAVVITNIMLVSVTERTREIGLRKSVGARRSDILFQFLVESATLSGVGGVLGVLLGVVLAAIVATASPLPARVAPWSVVAGMALGVGVGIAAGVYPAYLAARLDPIDALRRE